MFHLQQISFGKTIFNNRNYNNETKEIPKIILAKLVKNDMLIKNLIESMTSTIIEWRRRIYVVDPDYHVENHDP